MRQLILAAAVLFALPIGAQSYSCDVPVYINPSTLLTTAAVNSIVQAENKLIAKGADPRVIIDNAATATPEEYVETMHKQCASWKSADGGVKNSLVVFVVFPNRHKMGLFPGTEFGKALNPAIIRSQFMGPKFRDGDWTGGMISGINQTAVQIEAFQTSALHPATTVVQRQATDLSGLWLWLDLLLLVAAVVLAWFLVSYYRKRRVAVRDAQQRAVQARNDAASRVNRYPDSEGAEVFAKLSSSETYNPDTNDLSVDQYNEIARRYNSVRCEPPSTKKEPDSARTGGGGGGSKHHHDKRKHGTSDYYPPPNSPPPPVSSAPSSQSTTNIVHNTYVDRDPFYSAPIVPIIIEEPVYREEPRYRAPDPEPEPVRSSWSDNSSSSSFSDSSDGDLGGGGSDF